jgi:hypothetical protein
MRFRKLRIAFSALCGLAAVSLVVLWAGSDSRIYRITWHYNRAEALQVGSCAGLVELRTFKDSPIPVPPSANHTGREFMCEWFESMRLINGKMRWWFESPSPVSHFDFEIPHWFLIMIFCGLATMPWLRFRFTLRTLLIATTLIAAVLGLIVWTAR